MVSQAHSIYLIPDTYWGIIEFFARALHYGTDPGISIVDTDVQLSILFPLDALKKTLNIFILGMIHDNSNGIVSSSSLDLITSLQQVRFLPASDVYSGPSLSKLKGNAATDATAGTSDKGDTASERRGHFNLLLTC